MSPGRRRINGRSGTVTCSTLRGSRSRSRSPNRAIVGRVSRRRCRRRVKKGETVVLLEAMKMELPIRSLSDGTIAAVRCREGELVTAGQVLIEMQ
jgi:acetyl/propionyl-CoA carboxylase alpha subunit